MLEPAVLETLHTAVLTGLLLGCGALAVWSLPWSDSEIRLVHHTARRLFLARVPLVTVRAARAASPR